ncbi:MAG: WD40 repeat domain-containing protein [Chitinophagales bacterium]
MKIQFGFLWLLLCSVLHANTTNNNNSTTNTAKTILKPLATFIAHEAAVSDVCFDQQGRKIASAGNDGSIRIWDVAQTKPLQTLLGHQAVINDITFNTKGDLLASASNDGTVKIWNTKTGRLLQSIDNPTHKSYYNAVNFVLFDTEGKYIFFGGKNQAISKALIHTGEITSVYVGKDIVQCAKWLDEQGKMVFAAGKSIYFLDTQSGEINHSLNVPNDYIKQLSLSKDGETLFTWANSGKIYIWNTRTQTIVKQWQAGDYGNGGIDFCGKNQVVISGNTGNSVKLWDMGKNEPIHQATKHEQKVNTLHYHGASQLLITGSHDGTLKLWLLTQADTTKKDTKNILKGLKGNV